MHVKLFPSFYFYYLYHNILGVTYHIISMCESRNTIIIANRISHTSCRSGVRPAKLLSISFRFVTFSISYAACIFGTNSFGCGLPCIKQLSTVQRMGTRTFINVRRKYHRRLCVLTVITSMNAVDVTNTTCTNHKNTVISLSKSVKYLWLENTLISTLSGWSVFQQKCLG
jgi:hypothetical protein